VTLQGNFPYTRVRRNKNNSPLPYQSTDGLSMRSPTPISNVLNFNWQFTRGNVIFFCRGNSPGT